MPTGFGSALGLAWLLESGARVGEFSILNPEFVSIASRLSAALADRYRMGPRLGQKGKPAG